MGTKVRLNFHQNIRGSRVPHPDPLWFLHHCFAYISTVPCAIEIGSGYFMSRNSVTGGGGCHPIGGSTGIAAVQVHFFLLLNTVLENSLVGATFLALEAVFSLVS